MRRTDSVFLLVVAAIISFRVTYYLNPPAPRYYPLEHAWRMEKLPGKPSMAWYGRSLWGMGVGLAVAAVSAAVLLPASRGDQSQKKALPASLVNLLT